MARILFLMMLPFVCFSQITPSEDIPVNNLLKEKENLDTKRKASYNLDEIKVRWKKAALENCPGVPCVVTPPPPATACGSITTVLDGDGNSYQTVDIGTQCWTKSNLRATKYNDGVTAITVLTSDSDWAAAATGAAAGIITPMGSSTKNICPLGWHVPTRSDWNTLISFLGTNPGTQLKENSSLWTTPGSNISGFSARPGGYRYDHGLSFEINTATVFWERGTKEFLYINDGSALYGSPVAEEYGFSIRCIKDGI